jgi:hypothetical protein
MPASAPEDNGKAWVSLAIGRGARTQTLKSLRSRFKWLRVTASDVRVVEYLLRILDSCESSCERVEAFDRDTSRSLYRVVVARLKKRICTLPISVLRSR